MAFKDDTPRLEIVDLGLIDPDPLHVRKAISDEGLKGLTNAVRQARSSTLEMPYVISIDELQRLALTSAPEQEDSYASN